MRYLYTILFCLTLPFVCLKLLWRSFKLPAYRQRLGERFGLSSLSLNECIWVHAVSVGEVIAAIPIIRNLKKLYPDTPIVVTTMTPTGAERVKFVFGNEVYHLYLPYDLPWAVNNFLKAIHPVIAIMLETELWPNLFAACHKKKIPICLMNARLSAASARGYGYINSITKPMLQYLYLIAANSVQDAERFIELGAKPSSVVVTGNIKFDLELPEFLTQACAELRKQLGIDRFIWIAASTHQGEEEKILATHKAIREQDPTALLILVPRHPDRFAQVAKQCMTQFVTDFRSTKQALSKNVGVYLGDTMGELLLLYGVADVVFVGGSLVPHGGHNILEPALLKKPILTGPHLKNFAEISQLFLTAKALRMVENENALLNQLQLLRDNKQECMARGQRAYDVLTANRGALPKQMQLLEAVLHNFVGGKQGVNIPINR